MGTHNTDGAIYVRDIIEGDILMVSSLTWSGIIIKNIQGLQFNHCGQIIKKNNVYYVSEANPNGIAETPLSSYIDSYKYLVIARAKVPVTTDNRATFLRLHNEKVGKAPYAYLNLLCFQVVKFISIKIFGRTIWIGRKYNSTMPKAFCCGQWVMWLWNQARGYWDNTWYSGGPTNIWDATSAFYFYDIADQ